MIGCGCLGETAAPLHAWMFCRPELEFLKCCDAALTVSRAQAIAEAKPGKRHLVFAPARLPTVAERPAVAGEFAPLPFALYRVERA